MSKQDSTQEEWGAYNKYGDKLVDITDTEEWTRYKGRATLDVLLTKFAYSTKDESKKKLIADLLGDDDKEFKSKYEFLSGKELDKALQESLANYAKLIDDKFLLVISDDVSSISGNQYRAVALVNAETKEVIVANAGTRFKAGSLQEAVNLKSDLSDDMMLAFSKEPHKATQVKQFNELLLGEIGSDSERFGNIKDYKFHYTGHSLGAALGDIGAADMALRLRASQSHMSADGQPRVSCITFDTPGTRDIICSMYKSRLPNAADKTDDELIALYHQDVDSCSINSAQNLVNSTLKPSSKHNLNVLNKTLQDSCSYEYNIFTIFTRWMSEKCRGLPLIDPILKLISFGKSQLQRHKLDNFQDALIKDPDGRVMKVEKKIANSPFKDQKFLKQVNKVGKHVGSFALTTVKQLGFVIWEVLKIPCHLVPSSVFAHVAQDVTEEFGKIGISKRQSSLFDKDKHASKKRNAETIAVLARSGGDDQIDIVVCSRGQLLAAEKTANKHRDAHKSYETKVARESRSRIREIIAGASLGRGRSERGSAIRV